MVGYSTHLKWFLLLYSPVVTTAAVLGQRRGGLSGSSRMSLMTKTSRWGVSPPSSVNCTWKYFTQPLSHFEEGGTSQHGATFGQRYCIYDGFYQPSSSPPVYFYTGNESPVEVYVNNTGLMWELGLKYNALLVFAEHRYEGESVPTTVGVQDCLSYCTIDNALADFAALIRAVKDEYDVKDAAVISFGGSYGGMLSAWFRMKYPNVIAGAIAASAPIWGTPLVQQSVLPSLDGASVAITRGVSSEGGATDMCAANLLASWPLIHDIANSKAGLDFISSSLNLCTPVETDEHVRKLLDYLQTPWFMLAEGNYPFPSDYITFAVGPGKYSLPAWPLRVACGMGLDSDWGIRISGNKSDVDFTVSAGSSVSIKVVWNETSSNAYNMQDLLASGVPNLFRSLSDAVGVWFNATKTLSCFGPKIWETPKKTGPRTSSSPSDAFANNTCTVQMKGVGASCWGPINCNSQLNLINTDVQGVGRDMFWPPNVPQGYSVKSLLGPVGTLQHGCGESYSTEGLFGVPSTSDPWGLLLDDTYFGERIQTTSNIIFSNGMLDPWISGGVVRNFSSSGLTSLILPNGAHHLDLFFATAEDPPDVKWARSFEEQAINTFIQEWNQYM